MKKSGNTILSYLYEEPSRASRRINALATAVFALLFALALFFIVRRFYVTGQLEARYWSFFAKKTTWRFLLEGLCGTVKSAVLSGAVAFALGFLIMLMRLSRSKLLRALAVFFIEFTRGVPTLLFIYFFFLALPSLGVKMSALLKIVLPVALSACGVVAEVLRSGVNAVPRGQREAALSLGMRERAVFLKIIFPQGFFYVLPSLIAEIVIVVKDTTFAYIVNYPDIMQNAKVLISNYDSMLAVYLLVAAVYIALNGALNALSSYIAQKSKMIKKGKKNGAN